jgi:hypothetical protein
MQLPISVCCTALAISIATHCSYLHLYEHVTEANPICMQLLCGDNVASRFNMSIGYIFCLACFVYFNFYVAAKGMERCQLGGNL